MMWNSQHQIILRRCGAAKVLMMVIIIMICSLWISCCCHGYASTARYHDCKNRYHNTLLPTRSIIHADSNSRTRRYLSAFDEISIEYETPTHRIIDKSILDEIHQSIIIPIFVASYLITSFAFQSLPAYAAPPFAVIAEELGYYPIMVPTSPSSGSQSPTTIQYVAKRVQRPSTQQAIDLAHYMRTVPDHQIVLAGTYWCSHTSHQRELFGIEAWNELNKKEPSTSPSSNGNNQRNAMKSSIGFTYIECAPQGYRGNPTICSNLKIDGYPTWIITTTRDTAKGSTANTIRLSGERSLYDIANDVGYTNTFDASIEETSSPSPGLGPSACTLKHATT
jgi:hypothetical protein